jgi:hypothetical protein
MSFFRKTVELKLGLQPLWATDIMGGVLSQLDRCVLSYREELGGTLISYSDPVIVSTAGELVPLSSRILILVRVSCVIFSVEIGDLICMSLICLQANPYAHILTLCQAAR